MKKVLLFASMALFVSSCATRKYGCGLSSSNTSPDSMKHLRVTHHIDKYGKVVNDSAIVKLVFLKGKWRQVGYELLNYKDETSLCRGYGKVSVLEDGSNIKSYVIKIGGRLLRDEDVVTEVDNLVVSEGAFYNALTPYVNTGIDVYFEAYALFPNVFTGPDIQYSVRGCVDHVIAQRNDIILTKGK